MSRFALIQLVIAFDLGAMACAQTVTPPNDGQTAVEYSQIPDSDPFVHRLREAGIAPDSGGISRFLETLLPSSGNQMRLRNLINALGHQDFHVRQSATADLLAAPHPPISILNKALRSSDQEVRTRARHILSRVEHATLTSPTIASLITIQRSQIKGLAPLLLQLIPHLHEVAYQRRARQALIATAGPEDEKALRLAAHESDFNVRVSAIAAHCAMIGDQGAKETIALLEDYDEPTRLGVARALSEIGDQLCLPLLIKLSASSEENIATASIEHLRTLLGPRPLMREIEQSENGKLRAENWVSRTIEPNIRFRYPAHEVREAIRVFSHGGAIKLVDNDDWLHRASHLPWGVIRIAKVDLQGTNISDGEVGGLKDLDDLTHLSLANCMKLTPAALDQIAFLGNLLDLDLSNLTISDEMLERFRHLERLMRLKLSGCRGINGIAFSALKGFDSLVELELDGTSISDDGLPGISCMTGLRHLRLGRFVTDSGLEFLRTLTQLEHLELSYCAHVTGTGVRHLTSLQRLRSVRLYRCKSISDDALVHLGRIASLETLVLTCSRVTDNGVKHLSNLRNLKHLSLYTTQVSSECLKHVARLVGLRELNLSRTQVSDSGLGGLESITGLNSLNLSFTNVTDQGLMSLGRLRSLRELKLINANVQGFGLVYLAELPQLETLDLHNSRLDVDRLESISRLGELKELDLGNTGITDECVGHIAKLGNLVHLDVSRSREFTDVGLNKLRNLRNLESLNVRRTQVTAKGKDGLRISLPSLRYVDG